MTPWLSPEFLPSLLLAALIGAGLAGGGLLIVRQRLLSERQQLLNDLQQARFETQLSQRKLDDVQSELDTSRARIQQLDSALNDSGNRLARLETQHRADARHYEEQLQLLKENKEALKQEFSNLANEIFDNKGKRFAEQSQENLNALLKPFREQVEQFRKRVDDIHTQDTQGRAELKSQLESLKELNNQLNEQASDLTRALRGDKKLQGNWGELQVERILESAGLQRGREYEREANFKDEDGQNRRPDFIVHLPDGKHLIIDSKVSLNDYQQYVSAEDDLERDAALKRHIASVRQHIRSLSDKDYPHLDGMKAPDFVLMFMPIEPAFIAAFQADPQLFNDGFERNIVVVTPTTLLATLRTVANLWTLERQNDNAKKLFDQAGKVYDKLRIFAEKMEKLGNQLGTAQRTYDDAWTTLRDGRGSLVRQVEVLEELGASVRRKLPESIASGLAVDDAEDDTQNDNDDA
ncbi:DNA recombination protein RmuC [Saccharospirillum mangrovi]|uniref:DNA recombination protein RmuC n=1 Tax=Saccharospirillum mangrovi TaxID=2161747 RepID=UPI000D3B3C8A|nr:DNA recombination protein RmuC [Saccharospirillum mangrovi]